MAIAGSVTLAEECPGCDGYAFEREPHRLGVRVAVHLLFTLERFVLWVLLKVDSDAATQPAVDRHPATAAR